MDINGTSGNDTLDGTAVADVINGFDGMDQLTGYAGNDELYGGAGNDILSGGADDDLIDGGADTDFLTYTGAPSAVTIDLSLETAQNTGWGWDRIISIESLRTTPWDDVITGSSRGERIDASGGSGNIVHAMGGDDEIVGDYAGGLFDGGDGIDWLYYTASFGVTVDLAVLTAQTVGTTMGIARIQTIANVENILGSYQADNLSGDGNANRLFGLDGNDQLSGRGGADELVGGVGGDLVSGGDGNDILWGEGLGAYVEINGVPGADHLLGGDGNDELNGGGGIDWLEGGAGDDLLRIASAGSILDGGAGFDTVGFGHLGIAGGPGTTGLTIDMATPSNSTGWAQNTSFISIEKVFATVGADSIYGTAAGETLSGLAGHDQLFGRGGDDVLVGGSGTDSMDGGEGSDTADYSQNELGFFGIIVNLSSDPSQAPQGWPMVGPGQGLDSYGQLDTLTSIENVKTGSSQDWVVGSSGANRIETGAGDDHVSAGDGNDLVMAGAGNDQVFGGDGADIFYFGSAFTGADQVDGGAGRDVLILQGHYTLTLSGTDIAGIESISLQSGSRTNWGDTANDFYSYTLTASSDLITTGQELIVNGQSLRVGEDLTFNGSAEESGRFLVYGGFGIDLLTGGAGGDAFFFEGSRWGASDRVDGGAGRDALILSGSSGVNRIEFGANSLTGIESISVNARYAADPSQKPSYELVLHDNNVAAGGTLIVNGISLLDPAQTVNVDGSAESDGHFILFGGAGNDVLKGGSGMDTLYGAGGADTLTGGTGNDLFRYDSTSDSTGGAMDHILDFETSGDKIDLSRIDANTMVEGNQAFHWIGSNAFTGAGGIFGGQLRAFEVNNSWFVEGDVNGDAVADFVLQVEVPGVFDLIASSFIL